jgi:hypothetical protein
MVHLQKHDWYVHQSVQRPVHSGLACEHAEPVWRNYDGEMVDSEDKAFGLKKQV